MTITETIQIAECEICGASIEFDQDTILHELVECMDCATEYEVVSLSPITIEEAPPACEDWGQ